MNLKSLLQQREAVLRQAQLANLAYAHQRFGDFAARVERAGLRGTVELEPANPELEKYLPVLTALEGSQSVIEEHFTEEDVMELADLLAFVTHEHGREYRFRLETMGEQFVAPIARHLERLGVVGDIPQSSPGELNRQS